MIAVGKNKLLPTGPICSGEPFPIISEQPAGRRSKCISLFPALCFFGFFPV